VPDDSAFCPRCGANLASEEAAATATIDLGEQTDTVRLNPAPEPSLVASAPELKRLVTSPAWVDAATAAALSWLALLCLAAILLLAPKLQYPGFATGANPVDIFTGMVMVALGVLRVPLHLGKLTLVALPMGALIGFAATTAWATRSVFHKGASTPGSAVWPRAIRVAVIFSVIAGLLAVIFRFRGDEPAWAGLPGALFWGFLWTLAFSAIGLARGPDRWRGVAARAVAGLRSRSQTYADGLTAGALMIGVASLVATAALLLWIIGGLARETPYGGFGVGDAGAAILYFVAYLPNIIVALVSFSMGAPVLRGAQIGIGGRKIGGLHEVSLLQYPDGVPAYAFLLLIVPVIACLAGGYWIGRRNTSAALWKTVGVAAVTFAVVLALLGWLGEARLGAGLVEQRGFARVAISPGKTLVWALLWASVCGWLGSEIAIRSRTKNGTGAADGI
jgi:hypothetical protein